MRTMVPFDLLLMPLFVLPWECSQLRLPVTLLRRPFHLEQFCANNECVTRSTLRCLHCFSTQSRQCSHKGGRGPVRAHILDASDSSFLRVFRQHTVWQIQKLKRYACREISRIDAEEVCACTLSMSDASLALSSEEDLLAAWDTQTIKIWSLGVLIQRQSSIPLTEWLVPDGMVVKQVGLLHFLSRRLK